MDIARRPRTAAAVLLAAAGIGSLTLWPAGPAGAQDASAPSPCSGALIADKGGDDDTGPNSIIGGPPANKTGAAPYLDIRHVFFNFKGGVLTANVQVADLTPAIPEGSYEDAIHYVVEFDHIGETADWLQAIWDGTEWSFQYGAIESMDIPNGDPRSRPAETTGRVFPGPNGIVQIDVPADAKPAVGMVLEDVYAISGMWAPTAEAEATFFLYSDRAPDDSDDNATYTVTECPADPVAPPADDTAAPTQPPPPGPGPQPQPQPAPQPQSQPAAPTLTKLPFTVSKAVGSAKKAKRKKGFALKATSTRKITGLRLQLKKGRKVIATGRLAVIEGKRTIKFKLKRKALKRIKKGKYTLLASGTVDGKKLSTKQVVAFKK